MKEKLKNMPIAAKISIIVVFVGIIGFATYKLIKK